MTRKTTLLYEAVLRKSNTMESQFQPTQVIADFEEAPAAAPRNVYGDQLIVSGCWFHYAQALIKRLRKLGLTDAYRNDEETQTIFRYLLSLPLPFGDIAPGFQELKSLLTSQLATSATMTQLLRYVERQWISKHGSFSVRKRTGTLRIWRAREREPVGDGLDAPLLHSKSTWLSERR